MKVLKIVHKVVVGVKVKLLKMPCDELDLYSIILMTEWDLP